MTNRQLTKCSAARLNFLMTISRQLKQSVAQQRGQLTITKKERTHFWPLKLIP
jgi:hypothetical protein